MKTLNNQYLKHSLGLVLLFAALPNAWAGVYRHGTVIRMRMGDCTYSPHGFMATFGSPAAQPVAEVCPEYTLISDTVVYIIVGKTSGQMIPLADVIDFRLTNNELAVRVDDAKRENKFAIKEMILRSEWDLVQKHITDQLTAQPQPDNNVALRTRN